VVSRLLRSHYTTHPEGSLHFWDCPSDAKWFVQAKVHDEAVRTLYLAEENMRTSYDALARGTKGTTRRMESRVLEGRNPGPQSSHHRDQRDEALSSYTKGGTWLPHVGHSITLCARATRTMLCHAPISEFRVRFLQRTGSAPL